GMVDSLAQLGSSSGSRAGRGGGGSAAIGGAAPGGSAGSRAEAPAAEPSRVDAMAALRRVQDPVRRCMGERREVARVEVTVRGTDGRITAVNVRAPFAGTPAEACITRAVRTATMPRSRRETYRFQHAFRPAPIAGTGSSGATGNAVRSRRARQRPALDQEMVDEAEAR
ncbi:MAG TPA: hypothetical protein RMH99_21755, partial [Sandaracinaceae bacterium LLY-WYZ-13_1]|nr:hypothetical protein [Sandaracinaceae bacterium LLY-WYZ-13_1]